MPMSAPQHRSRRPDAKRAAKAPDPFYKSARWIKMRRVVLARDCYTCMACDKVCSGHKEAHIDHIKERADYPELELDADNLQTLCASCHSRKTRRGGHNDV